MALNVINGLDKKTDMHTCTQHKFTHKQSKIHFRCLSYALDFEYYDAVNYRTYIS